MNLKQAAQRLSVHYQTAYRWVREGELAAIKIGNRYEVSDASVEQFLSRRHSLKTVPMGEPQPTTGESASVDHALSELRILAGATRSTPQPCFDAATVIVASTVGDAAVLRLLDDTGRLLEPISSFARAPETRAALIGAITSAGSFSRDAPVWSDAERVGEVHVVHHMPQDVIRELFGEEARFVGRGVRVLSAAIAPIFIEDEFAGGLLALKSTSYAPFGRSEIARLEEAAEFCREALHRANRFVGAWRASTHLTERLAGQLARDMTPAQIAECGARFLANNRSQALVASDGSLLASSCGFERTMRSASTDPHDSGTFLGTWSARGVRDVVEGGATHSQIDPLVLGDPTAIVTAVRGPDAALRALVVDVVTL